MADSKITPRPARSSPARRWQSRASDRVGFDNNRVGYNYLRAITAQHTPWHSSTQYTKEQGREKAHSGNYMIVQRSRPNHRPPKPTPWLDMILTPYLAAGLILGEIETDPPFNKLSTMIASARNSSKFLSEHQNPLVEKMNWHLTYLTPAMIISWLWYFHVPFQGRPAPENPHPVKWH